MILSHPFQHHFCLGKPPLLHFLWTDFTLVLSMLCNNILDLAGVSPHPGKAAEMRRDAGDGWGCLCAASICRVGCWEGGWWPRRAEREAPVAVQGCSWQECDSVKSLNESWKGFCTQRKQKWRGGLWRAAATELSPSQLSSVKQRDGLGVSGTKMCGQSTALVGGVLMERHVLLWVG